MPSGNTRRRVGAGETTASMPSSLPWNSGLVERVVIRVPQQRLANRRQQVIVVVVTDVERQVAVDPLERRRTIQRSGAAGADAVLDHALGEVLDDMTGPAPSETSVVAPPGVPLPRDAAQPQVRGLDVDRHLRDVVLDIRIVGLLLRREVVERKLV